jgi:hypothetical protein
METDFCVVDHHVKKNGDVTAEFKESDGKILVKHFAGVNSDNFLVKKIDGRKIEFSFFKLNGIYYVNINGHHMIDYKKFVNIQSILSDGDNNIKIKNVFVGEIFIPNCDLEIMKKALLIMNEWMKRKSWWFTDLVYFFFHA